ncbi:hypothetical protein [Bifidobacterium moukalabense]|uniref:hypothetical protein n=1 Tax=Bifidobacterium moukalabense TaxID=1333651 RepID=UPI0010F57C29|nr:hypothetical protein [Bifidobacterium moukalabense]
MNIGKGDSITSIELEASDFRPESLVSRLILNTDNTVIAYVPNETAIAMRDKLNEIFPPESDEPELGLPEEPKEHGYYLTSQIELLIRDNDGDWYRPGNYTWKNDHIYTVDWGVVYETLGDEAFPLTKLNTGKEH